MSRLFWGSTKAYEEAPYWKRKEEVKAEPEKVCYLAGPMRNYRKCNYDAFIRGAAILRADGWTVYSPQEHDAELGHDHTISCDPVEGEIAWDVQIISTKAKAFIMLPGWEQSKGVTGFELPIAIALGLPLYEFECLKTGILYELTKEEVEDRLAEYAGV